ncbi:MAG TPA: bifunctional riboflavin kinase/FAD synthetase, partial [Gammaproteobacteria bacterium]|nr:bifunctional riboflavin kinase/FAD synthetase [Gammaproteobacteria bacterium]
LLEVFLFKHKIRDEEKFDSFEQLKQQIKLDTQQAKSYFNTL